MKVRCFAVRIIQRRPSVVCAPLSLQKYYPNSDLNWQEFVHLLSRVADSNPSLCLLTSLVGGKGSRLSRREGPAYRVYAVGRWGDKWYVLGGSTAWREAWNYRVLQCDEAARWCLLDTAPPGVSS